MGSFYRDHGKRVLDVVFALCAMPFVAASFVVAATLIKLDDGGPILYIAPRRGYKGQVFNMYKFRSMKVNSPVIKAADGSTLSSDNDPRLTRVGRFLRKTSIDEFPQFLNVLKGDMSIVGPRPTLTGIPYEQYDATLRKRLEVKPGITGYSQAYVRTLAAPEDRFEMDCVYVDKCSLLFDMMILGKTVQTVLEKKGVTNA